MGWVPKDKKVCLFDKPLIRLVRYNPLPELFEKTEHLNDDRLLALVTALIIEDRLDCLLKAFLPRYSRLTEKQDFTFSTKIALAQALAFIPPHILSVVDALRSIRNAFAHQLEMERFDQLGAKYIARLKNLSREIFDPSIATEEVASQSEREAFTDLAAICIIGLETFRTNVECLRAYLEKDGVIESIIKESEVSEHQEIDHFLSQYSLDESEDS